MSFLGTLCVVPIVSPGITVRTTNVTAFALLITCTLLFTAAGSAKVEVNDQQIQTEIVETEHKSVQVGSMTKQQGVCTTVCYDFTK